jgi:hypothetical protein
MRMCDYPGCSDPVRSTHPEARWCSKAHRQAGWKERVGYRLVAHRKASQRRPTREGRGVRVYISTQEAEELAAGRLPGSVVRKAQSKLKPADPIPGQQSIYDVLTEEPDANEDA